MTSLVPEVVNARQIGRDVEQLAIMLSQGTFLTSRQLLELHAVLSLIQIVPGFQFASLLRDVISRARRNKVLPPASRPGSPRSHQAPAPAWISTSQSQTTQPTEPSQEYNSFAFDQPSEPFPALDFSYAEQLLGTTSGMNGNGSDTPITGFVSASASTPVFVVIGEADS